ncbi:hypothetical protein Tco_1258228, partial [Tanacetum coccineum]
MARNHNAHGWTWVFGKNKNPQSKPIVNPFVKDVENLWKEFQQFGRIIDAFIANKRSKTAPPSNGNKGPSLFPARQSDASVANGGGASKGVSDRGSQDTNNCLSLSDNDLIKVEDTSTVLLAKVKEVDSISNMYGICRNEGFTDVSIHYIGGLWVWIQFENSKSCEAFKENESLKSFWTIIRYVSPSFTVDERLIWIEIRGLPLCAWGSNAIKKVTSFVRNKSSYDLILPTVLKELEPWSSNINEEYTGNLIEKDGESRKKENHTLQMDGRSCGTAVIGGKPTGFEKLARRKDILHAVPTKEDSGWLMNGEKEKRLVILMSLSPLILKVLLKETTSVRIPHPDQKRSSKEDVKRDRSKTGKRFSFVRFLGVRNGEDFAKTMSNIWIGSYHLFVSISKFERTSKIDTKSVPKFNVPQAPPSNGNKGPSLFPARQSYASVANGGGASKGVSDRGSQDTSNCLSLSDNDLIKVEDTSTVLLSKYVSPSFTVDERLIWIEIRGLPLCVWGSNAIKKVTSLFGKFKFFDSDSENTMSLGRACISTKRQSTISESVSVIIHGKSFDVHVHEIGAWSTIINDEYREPDEKNGEAESHTSNEEENPMDTLDDFVEQVVEEKGKSHSINEGSHVETASSGGKPLGFENVVKKEAILHSVPTKEDSVVNSKEEEKKASDSDVS